MSSTSLREFVSQTMDAGRIRFGDLRRLQRDILRGRITSQEEAELLLSLDRTIRKADRDWDDYLVSAVKDFVVWRLEPIGSMDSEKVNWLTGVVGRPTTKAGRILTRDMSPIPS